MTSLRTSAGMDLTKIAQQFGDDYSSAVENDLARFAEKNWIEHSGSLVKLTTNGKLYADHIASELFVEYRAQYLIMRVLRYGSRKFLYFF